ncbi:MOSC N-terminal beta barrel domain-containing protein [Caulobacter segnis]|uniref:MOSC domain-containing protein n=1 Tax=Caulobacter segnis TaxID=88688 RepID=UPI00240EE285|nr:MOSC N-terminal beta barrel domain-containing protein [Caulobacter segnis]MDG2520903.1 MOSC N-terminal beta barrel domain-containing protein [Caulobacter segnis]
MARITSLYRHPVKGFTPERLDSVTLRAGEHFPCDRLYAVEDGPSGFDPDAPAHLSKMKFTVLAKIPAVAGAHTAYDEATATLRARADGAPDFEGRLSQTAGREAFAAWLAEVLKDDIQGPLRVLEGPGQHRFMDSKSGFVSIINLASVRDLAEKIGRPVDPLRFRGNVYVEGWEPWVENGWADRTFTLGGATVQGIKPIVRCAATHVNPTTAERDMDVVKALFDHYGHMLCGLYVRVLDGGVVAEGDETH